MASQFPHGSRVPLQRIGGAASDVSLARRPSGNTAAAFVPGGWFGGWLGVVPYWQSIPIGPDGGTGVWNASVWNSAVWGGRPPAVWG